PNDEEALKRVINYPRRGIGDTSLERIFVTADQQQYRLWDVVVNAQQFLDGRSANAVGNFGLMIQSVQAVAKTNSAFDTAMHLARHSRILKDLAEEKSVEGLSRYENIQELLNAIKELSEREDIEERGLDIFMQGIAVLTNDDKDKDRNADT